MKNKSSRIINTFVALVTLTLFGCGGGGGGSGGGDSGSSKITCASFSYQEDAQAYFKTNNATQLDGDNDGIACEELPSRPIAILGSAPSSLPTQSPTPTPTSSTAEGLWVGTTNTFRAVTGIVLEDGTYWVFYSIPHNSSVIAGVVQGTGSSLNGSFSSAGAKDLNLEGKGIDNATVSASITSNRTFAGPVTYSSLNPSFTFTSTYDPAYEEIPRLTRVAGVYTGIVGFNGATEAATLTITSSGAISGRGASGCEFAGTTTPRAKGNVFDISVTFGGGVCINGTSSVSGISYFDAKQNRLFGTAINSARTNALIFAGTKP